ncbi:helix-turn-helix domain-containing protein [Rhodovulum sp. YEN HP10]|uniref:helix-turn-helix domain-containing protein n=1 Tax=Rhodovulum sp. HP10 TaxID=3387397 RepID=UPI0039DF8FA1
MRNAQQLIAVDAAALAEVLARLDRIEAKIAPPPQWLTVHEAAARLGCTASTIRRKIAAGEIEARGSGRARMVRLG